MTDDDLWIDADDALGPVPELAAKAKTNGKKAAGRRRHLGGDREWILRAAPYCKRSGAPLALALYLSNRSALTKSNVVTVSNNELRRDYHVERHAKLWALACLVDAGMVRIEKRKSGRATVVTILD
jgi:hypothetical protein